MRNVFSTVICFFVVSLIGGAQADIIDFDSLNDGDVVTNQFSNVTFSTVAGKEIRVTAQNFGTSAPNFICTADIGGALNCINETTLDFANPVNGLTFFSTGDNDSGVTALVDVFENGLFSSTVNVVTNGNFNDSEMVDLTGFTDVNRIRIHGISDAGGLGWDDFEFTSVPEPNSFWMVAFFIVGLTRGKRN